MRRIPVRCTINDGQEIIFVIIEVPASFIAGKVRENFSLTIGSEQLQELDDGIVDKQLLMDTDAEHVVVFELWRDSPHAVINYWRNSELFIFVVLGMNGLLNV